MRLVKARVQMYRSVIDTGEFEVENGKTVILQALQKLNAPEGAEGFDSLRDYPRSQYNKDIRRGLIDAADLTVVEGHFQLEPTDLVGLPDGFDKCTYVYGRKLNNEAWHRLQGSPALPTYGSLSKDLIRLAAHADKNGSGESPSASEQLASLTSGWDHSRMLASVHTRKLITLPQQIPVRLVGNMELFPTKQ